MGTISKIINRIIIFIILLGIVTAGVDYWRMMNGEVPIFNKSQYDLKTKKQTFQGLFYSAERKVLLSMDEGLDTSSNIKYKLLFFFPLDVVLKQKDSSNFVLFGQGSVECDGVTRTYFTNDNVKVYTYCLDDIFIKEKDSKSLLSYLENDDSILSKIDNNFGYLGLSNNSMMVFQSREEIVEGTPLVMYRCFGEEKSDVYFTPVGVFLQNDFCTYKNDTGLDDIDEEYIR